MSYTKSHVANLRNHVLVLKTPPTGHTHVLPEWGQKLKCSLLGVYGTSQAGRKVIIALPLKGYSGWRKSNAAAVNFQLSLETSTAVLMAALSKYQVCIFRWPQPCQCQLKWQNFSNSFLFLFFFLASNLFIGYFSQLGLRKIEMTVTVQKGTLWLTEQISES